jgi:hypothetical protein
MAVADSFTFLRSFSNSDYTVSNEGMKVTGELERMWKDAVVA